MASRPGSGKGEASLAGVTHVFFDAGGTLLAPSPGPAEIFRRVLAKHGHIVDLEMIRNALRTPELIVTLIRPLPRAKEKEFYRTVNARLVEHLGFDPEEVALDDIHASFEKEVGWRAYPEAVLALHSLRSAGYRLGVISNASHSLPKVLGDAGIAPLLDTVTYSFEVGAEKPHPRIFLTAVARANASPERALMVGDSYEADYLGARNAGLHALLLRRDAPPPGPCPSIRSLAELETLLAARRSHAQESPGKGF